jgi:ubiquinone/menaquinone biosynthesis C-methylase UbiE
MEPQTWWNKNIDTKLETFKGWVGDWNAPSKQYMANYLKNKSYSSLIDAGCANATFYHTLKYNNINIDYIGVDSCKQFIETNNKNGIQTIDNDIRDMKHFTDSSIDIVFSRHTLEHQPNFEQTLNEFIRVANQEVCHIFFIPPKIVEKMDYNPEIDLYHNVYSISKIETFLQNHSKVSKWNFAYNIGSNECALHIYKK